MVFQPTALNVTLLLVVALGIAAGYLLSKGRFDTNLVLFFYLVVLVYQNWSSRQVNGTLYVAGLALALLLRFEFMNTQLTKLVLFLEIGALATINVIYLGWVFIF
jgi:hypothetical protein